ncbi:hypothetical protein Nhal_0578 [Nitrosococcus halophilus Nc 4]|uniref:Uncharacterized protein n=1 Tax=Nitrosococcus halophilus (strain Nc4) TaxID=472759 RepID=D5BWB2_NITHN|nr:hypothetical protein Nhal_0578 [Nitrosococcus halophilus Nc 4]
MVVKRPHIRTAYPPGAPVAKLISKAIPRYLFTPVWQAGHRRGIRAPSQQYTPLNLVVKTDRLKTVVSTFGRVRS